MPQVPADQPPRHCRPHRLRPGDWVRLGAGAAGGFVAATMARDELERLGDFIRIVRPMISIGEPPACEVAARRAVGLAARLAESSQVFLLVFAVGLASVAVRRRPDPPSGLRHRIGPGRVSTAILVGTLALASLVVDRYQWLAWLREARPEAGPGRVFWVPVVRVAQAWAGWAILIAWLVTWTERGRRRPEDAVERVGRWIGWAWLVAGAIRWAEKLLPP